MGCLRIRFSSIALVPFSSKSRGVVTDREQCQCIDGPFYPDTTIQCISCNHALCANCEVKGLPPADEFV